MPTAAPTTVTTTSLSDSLPTSVPKLDASHTNWVIFTFHFQDAMEAKGFWGHFDGTSSRPVANPTGAPTSTELIATAQWEKDK
jgi:hypothetical protein